MPAVAQINVNFANRFEFSSQIPRAGVSTVKSISPYTLVQYMLFNREDSRFQPPAESDVAYLNYKGGFISAGDKVNVKHDSDLKLRQNLDVERSIFSEKIYSRRFGNTIGSYQTERGAVPRSVTIAPSIASENSLFFQINLPTATDRFIDLRANTTSITLENTSTTNNINLSCTNFNLTNTSGLANVTGKLNVMDDASFQKNVKIVGSSSANTETFEIRKTDTASDVMFKVDSANGNVNFKGDLDINSKFKVDSATGDTEVGSGVTGDLKVYRDTTINRNLNVKNETTVEKKITIITSDTSPQSDDKRIVGVRRVDTANKMDDILNPSSIYQNDALAMGDLRSFLLQDPIIIDNANSYTLSRLDNQRTILINRATTFTIFCPEDLINAPVGLQISFIRVGIGKVKFQASGNATLLSTPTNLFTYLAFTNSVATVFHGKTNSYYLFGDLLPS